MDELLKDVLTDCRMCRIDVEECLARIKRIFAACQPAPQPVQVPYVQPWWPQEPWTVTLTSSLGEVMQWNGEIQNDQTD